MTDVVVGSLRAEYADGDALGIGVAAPRLSWITTTDRAGWMQSAYEIELDGTELGRVDSAQSVFVAWPAPPLTSRAQRRVRVRVWGGDSSRSAWSAPLTVEAGLLSSEDWTAPWIAATTDDDPGRPRYFRRTFAVRPPDGRTIVRARLYATSAGINQLFLNGEAVGDTVLDPGWSAYERRIRYATHDVTALVAVGENALGAIVGDGWWRGHLSWEMRRNVYGDRLGLLAQLEITYSDDTVETVVTDASWRTAYGPILQADLYNGETFDARLERDGWSRANFDDTAWATAETFSPAVGALVARLGPPVRRTEERPVRDVIVTPTGRTVLDFGQNLVGWIRFTVEGPSGATVVLRHAEVLERGELGTRPLRNAEATDRYTLHGDGPETWEPSFTFHGFRYAEVDGWPDDAIDPQAFTAVVVHSDFPRTGTFSCSHELLQRLHENVVWGMRGNFVDVPTDCPQRDERLGWTGDLQVFAPTATFLYDVAGFLADWLEDLRAEQLENGAVPLVVPTPRVGGMLGTGFVAAAWGDAATFLPWTLYERYDDTALLARQFDSMRAWVDFVHGRVGDDLLWPREFQLGDWLDPDAPPDQPWRAKTDPVLVASAYFARSAQIVADAAAVLGRTELAEEYAGLARAVRAAFRAEYVAPSGLISSDSVTAYALAIAFDLYDDPTQRARAATRIAELAEQRAYQISTGFVGTPLVLPALTAAGDTRTAYRLVTETACPSWLYTVTMGATTIWERWDSMLPDGSINPGEMTSFNHYALGSVADWLHRTVGGLAPAAPGYRELRVAPQPGRGVVSASSALRTPYGRASCAWHVDGTDVTLDVTVPANASATVVRPGHDGEPLRVLAGVHHWEYSVPESVVADWADEPRDDVPFGS
jgi:alpha-L-rhamnosidase